MWFAFKIYIFGFLIQQILSLHQLLPCCDLLSKFISLAFWYNMYPHDPSASAVVICFQNLYLWLSDTTIMMFFYELIRLWFAFKIYIFGFLIQLTYIKLNKASVVICFQNLYLWLSDTTNGKIGTVILQLWFAFKIYIFGFLIQLPHQYQRHQLVVICFQNLYLWLSDTTINYWCDYHHWLWFAFKIYIFGFLIQLSLSLNAIFACCDLLSKFISLAFWYNKLPSVLENMSVVICFQNLYLWLSDTTAFSCFISSLMLWFAFKIYIFGFLIQPY